MRFTLEELVQRELHYAIVDEVDSILIDEARTPLIISGPADESTDLYYKIDRIIPKLRRAATIVEGKLSEIEAEKKGDFIVDEKARAVALTEEGIASCERLLNVDNLYDPRNMTMLHHIQQGLRAHALFRRGRRLHRQGRPGHHRRRVHRAPDARPALVGRAAPGGRGQGGRADRAREPDAGDDHVPELLPHVRQARRHDRHRRDRGGGVRQDLQARRHGGAHEPHADPRQQPGRRVQDRAREVQRGRRRHHRAQQRAASRCWSAPSRSRSPKRCRAS